MSSAPDTSTSTAGERTFYRTCPLCEATCGVEIKVEGDQVKQIRGDDDDVMSGGFICPKGTTLGALHEDPDRLRAPLIKRDGKHVEVSWDEAFAFIAQRTAEVREEFGEETFAAYLGNPNVHNSHGIGDSEVSAYADSDTAEAGSPAPCHRPGPRRVPVFRSGPRRSGSGAAPGTVGPTVPANAGTRPDARGPPV